MEDYAYRFEMKKSAKEVFELLLNIEQWWSGIHEETIIGQSQKEGDEFTFSAGSGAHVSKQKLLELIPNNKIVWQVTESNLSFLENPKEWKNTQLVFDISETKSGTQITFTHQGLQPEIECYNGCSTAWTQYFNKLEEKLNAL